MKRGILVALFLIGCGSVNNSVDSSNVVIKGSVVDGYVIGADIEVYSLDGKRIDKGCKSGEYGLFECNITSADKYIIIASGGYEDTDGNLSTNDKQLFNYSLIGVGDINHSVIISPYTTKAVAIYLGEEGDKFEKGFFNDKLSQISLNYNFIYELEKNLPTTHLLATNDTEFIKQEAKNTLFATGDVQKGDFRLRIMHINDTHSYFEPTLFSAYINSKKVYFNVGGYARIAKYTNDIKSYDSHSLFLHAGDEFVGTLYYVVFKGKANVELLNKMSLDAFVIGNHDLDDGAENFYENFAKNANFSILAANIDTTNYDLKQIIKPYIIKEVDNQKVAIVGDTLNASLISNPGPTIEFANYLDRAKQYVLELKEKGINKIIFLTHLGYDDDKILASEVPDIDVIVGGHSHTLIGDFSNLNIRSYGEYPTIIEHNNSKTLILTAWKNGLLVGDIQIVFDENGVVKNYIGTPKMLVDSVFYDENNELNSTEIKDFIEKSANLKIQDENQDIKNMINTYKLQVDKEMNVVIGKASDDLIHVKIPGDIDYLTGKVLEYGSMVAPHVALGMFQKANLVTKCDFAFQNAGGVKSSIYKGDITLGKVYEVLPYSNTLIIATLDGKNIKEMFEGAIDRALIKKWDKGAFPYLANAKIVIDTNNSFGNRIVEFKIKKDGEWVDFDENQTYTFATNSYIANGGDYYSQMWRAQKIDTGFIDNEIFLEYIKTKEVLAPLSYEEVPVLVK